ncbi:MAG TPA: MFS transporter [Candidatus Limnocylindria bacterium]|nr:MFS transporter [Candidatus Limnocylindria bacterium]
MSLSRDPNFLKVWSGYTFAVVGSQITVLALPLTAVLLLGASATETGLLVAARMSPALFLVLFIGAWVDRLPRRPMMIVSDLGNALVIASVPLAAWLGVLGMAQLYLVSFLAGVFALTVELARSALVPALVGRGQLVAANSRLQGSSAVAHVAGPSLGGVLVQALSAPTAMLFDALSFLASAALITAVRVSETVAPRTAGSRVWHEIVEGLRWMRGHDIVFHSIVAIALANIEWFAVQAILIVYATRELALPPALLGLAIAAIGPLSLLGAALAGPLTRRWGLGPIMIAALMLETVSRLLLPFAGGTPLQAAALVALSQALLGLTVPLWTVSSNSLQQAVTPERLLGRVNAATRFVGLGVAPPAALGAGLLADAIGFRATLFASGVIAAVAVLYLWLSPVRGFRHLEAHKS